MQKPYDVKIDLYSTKITDTLINYIVGDSETMPLTIKLTSKKKAFIIPDNSIVTLNMINPKGILFPRLATITDHEKGIITYEVDKTDIAVFGQMSVSVLVVNGSKRLSWRGFRFRVVRNFVDGQTEPPEVLQPWVDSITEMVAESAIRSLPVGGEQGQVLVKQSDEDFNTDWANILTEDTKFVIGKF